MRWLRRAANRWYERYLYLRHPSRWWLRRMTEAASGAPHARRQTDLEAAMAEHPCCYDPAAAPELTEALLTPIADVVAAERAQENRT